MSLELDDSTEIQKLELATLRLKIRFLQDESSRLKAERNGLLIRFTAAVRQAGGLTLTNVELAEVGLDDLVRVDNPESFSETWRVKNVLDP